MWINTYLEEASKVDVSNLIYGLIGVITIWIFHPFYPTRSKRKYKKLSRFIDNQNKTVYAAKGIKVINPISNGLQKVK